MKVMVIVKATKDSEAGIMPSEEMFLEMGKYNEELAKAGIMLDGAGLHPSSQGARVRFSGKNRTVIKGPFTETNEIVAGFWMWQVESFEEAIEWVKRCPNPMLVDSEIEIRRVFSVEDFGESYTPEVKAQEDRIRTQIEGREFGPDREEQGHAMTIAGINASYDMESRKNIPDQWHKFGPHIGKIPGQVGKVAYGVCWNFKGECDFEYLTGVEIASGSQFAADMTSVHLPARRYAVFVHREHVSKLPETISKIWTKWAPAAKYEASDAPSFERYSEEFCPDTGVGGMEIWVPLDK